MISQQTTQSEKQHTLELINTLSNQGIKLKFVESSNNSVVSQLIFPAQLKRRSINGQSQVFQGMVVKEIKHKYEGQHCEQCLDLQNEVKQLKNIQHEFIIKLHDNQIHPFTNSCAIFLPQASCDLFDYMTNTIGFNNNNYLQNIRVCFNQIASAIQYLHEEKNLVHGDIKPENIFVFKNCFKLADFGFCKQQEVYQSRETFLKYYSTRSLKYLPPEFADCLENIDFNMNLIDEYSSDVFGLGVALFQVIFKQCPYDQDTDSYCRNPYSKQESENQKQSLSALQQTVIQSSNDNTQNMKIVNMSQMKPVKLIKSKIQKIANTTAANASPPSTSVSNSPQTVIKKRQNQKKRKFYHKEDNLYKRFYSPNDIQHFWDYFKEEIQEIKKSTNSKDSDIELLKDLIQKSITPFHYIRLSISDFINHPWFNQNNSY